jgi:hypothetical protein
MRSKLVEFASSYPDAVTEMVSGRVKASLRAQMIDEIERIMFEIKTLSKYVQPKAKVADLGSGVKLFAPGLALLGFESILVDDFRDRWHSEVRAAL